MEAHFPNWLLGLGLILLPCLTLPTAFQVIIRGEALVCANGAVFAK